MKKVIISIVIIIFIIALAIFGNKYYADSYNFKLKGSENILLNIGDIWEDPGYIVDNNKEIFVNNNINYNKIGNYEVTYTLKIGLFSKVLTRKIIIVGEDEKTNFTINLQGNNPYYLLENHSYQEPGYDAKDIIDGNITNKVQITQNINSTLGTYDVTYQATNSDGITKKVTRKIIVYNLKFEGHLKTLDYSQDNEVRLKINDNNYQYTILPNNSKTTENDINYPIDENGNYTFKIYDKNNNSFDYIANVTNIDKKPPTGTCTMSLLNIGAKITVTAQDNVGIEWYEYKYGNNTSAKVKSNIYNISSMDEKSSVTLYDHANNTNTITCTVVDNSTKHSREYTLESYKFNGTTKKYWFYKPKRSDREKYPLVIYFHGAGGYASEKAVNSIVIPKNIKDGHDFPYYVIAPYKGDQNDFIISLINYVIKNNNIDTKRIILSGGSAGTPGALKISSKNPNLFSCVVLIATGSIAISMNPNDLTKLPMWFFQGDRDNLNGVKNFINKINAAGGNAKLTTYSGGHDAPADAFLRNDLTNWILNNKSK